MASDLTRRIGRVEGRLAATMAARAEADMQARLAALTLDELEAVSCAWKWLAARGLDLTTDRAALPPDQLERVNAVAVKWAAIRT